MTALDIISSALRLDGVLASGEVPNNAEAQDALVVLNDMLNQWNAERLMVFTIARQVFSLVPTQQLYTMGVGGNFNVPRPARIESASILSLQNPAQPMELPIEIVSETGWQNIPVKDVVSSLPQVMWDGDEFPLRNLSFWPIPTVPVSVVLYTWTALSSFPDLSVTDLTFPPGYAKAIRFCLALDLAPEYGKTVAPDVAAQAIIAKAVVKSINMPTYELHSDVALINPYGGRYNWRSDTPAGWGWNR